jgi:phage terminase large subunit-like protein
MVIIDEYHAHPTSGIHDVLYSGFGKRQQSLMCIITTAGKDSENSPAKREYDICCKILDEEILDETYFVMIRELDKEDDPHGKQNWVKANPILQEDNEYSRLLLDQIEAEYNLAYNSGDPDKIREFLIKRCDLWQSDSEDKYMSGCMGKWKALAVPRDKFLEMVKNKECWAGIDLSKTTDLTAVGFVFRMDDGRYAVCAHGFMPEERAAQHEHSDRVPYRAWEKAGWCTRTEGAVTDYKYIKSYIHDIEFDEGWKIKEICYDPYNATHFTSELEAEGYQRVEIRQGVQTLSEPTKYFRELILTGRIVHDGSRLLTWCLSNALETTDNNGNIKLSKKHKDDSQRIDLAAAIINAMVRAMVSEEKPAPGVIFL